jgi:hypothetical protein
MIETDYLVNLTPSEYFTEAAIWREDPITHARCSGWHPVPRWMFWRRGKLRRFVISCKASEEIPGFLERKASYEYATAFEVATRILEGEFAPKIHGPP